MDAKVGDIVHVLGRFTGRTQDGLAVVNFSHRCEGQIDLWVRIEDIVHVEPRALAVGDVVLVSGIGSYVDQKGIILAIDDDLAWIKRESGYGTYGLSTLTRTSE